ncbi:MAG: sigma-54-dependent transcriptional regulator [Pirellulales bacterium]
MLQKRAAAPSVGPSARYGCCEGEFPRRTSASALRCMDQAEKVSGSRCPVLIVGEAGTDLDEWAQRIHRINGPSAGPWFRIDCRQLDDGMAAYRLFGHEAGGSPMSPGRSLGALRAARGGTVLLSDLPSLPISTQVQLSRVFRDHEVRPVGAQRSESIDVRILATSHQRLRDLTAARGIHVDLARLLVGAEIKVPSLRESVEDIPCLVDHYSRRFAARYRRPVWRPTVSELESLCRQRWPGNDRQLAEVVERVYAFDCAVG